jgi:hypothetical protein
MLIRPLVVAGVAALVFGAASMQASSSLNHINHLTFSGAVSLPGVTLAPGTYTFEAGPQDTDRSVVRVLTRDRRTILYQGFTTPVSRPESTAAPVVVFGEALAGQPTPIRVWYPMQRRIGHQFRY